MSADAKRDSPSTKPRKVLVTATGSPKPRDLRDAERIFANIADPSARDPISEIETVCRDFKGILHFAKVSKERVAAAQLNLCVEEMHKAKTSGVHPVWENLNSHYRMLELVAIEPEYQGQGIAAELVQWIEQNARSRGIRYIVAVIESNAQSIGFFERLEYDVQPPGEPLYVAGAAQRLAPFTIEPDYRWVVKALAPHE